METSKYVQVGNKTLHFHQLGKGPAIVLMHPSPHDAMVLMPLAKELEKNYTVFAIDTPGYGKSDGLGFEPKSVRDYTKFLKDAFELMGLKKPSLYGSATGAQLAIRYALENPEITGQVFLDNAAHFTDDLRSRILQNYFPDLTPTKNGSHLRQIWNMVCNMFQYFPWCFNTDEFALNRPQLPVVALHIIALDYLKTGKSYDHAYKVAFEHERAQFVQELKVQTTIFRWNNSIIAKHVDDLLAFNFPSNVNSFYIEGDANERMRLMTEFINKKAVNLNSYRVSDNIRPYTSDNKLAYAIGGNKAPEIDENGQYLLDAWDILVKYNPDLKAEEIQACLVDWFTKY